MMTNGVALTKEVDSLDDIAVGDVVTYHVMNDNGKKLLITHRIIAIDNGQIYTKGDNNNVDDGFPLSIDNIEAKVVGVFNGTAWLAAKWQTTRGKVMLICFVVAIVLLCYTLKTWRADMKDYSDFITLLRTEDTPVPDAEFTEIPASAESSAPETQDDQKE